LNGNVDTYTAKGSFCQLLGVGYSSIAISNFEFMGCDKIFFKYYKNLFRAA